MLLPGPEAIQLAIYIGWLLHKIRGGIVAGALFVVPSSFVLWTLSYIYAAFGNLAWIAAIFYGLKPAVTAIVLVAVIRIGRKALKNEVMWALAVLAFVAIYFLKVPFPAIVLGAGAIGFFGGLFWKSKFETSSSHEADATLSVISDEQESPPHTRPNFARAVRVSIVCLILWLAPTIVAGVLRGWDHAHAHRPERASAVAVLRELTPGVGQRRSHAVSARPDDPHADVDTVGAARTFTENFQ